MSALHMDQTLILGSTATVPGSVDCGGAPSIRSSSGGWSSALFIIWVEVMERFAYYGIASNLITYLTEVLGQSTATAAQNVNAWAGVAALMPLLGAFIADSYLGRYRTVIIASCLYILGLGLLTLSAVLTSRAQCFSVNNIKTCSTSTSDLALFFFSLYLVALASGGHKPCVEAFGADQFDEHDPVEMTSKSSFFNWWYFGLCAGASVTILVVVYIQDNLNWSLGFGIPCAAMVVALVIFLLGTKRYRYSVRTTEKDPFIRIRNVFVAAVKNRKREAPSILPEEDAGNVSARNYKQFKFLNKALVIPDDDAQESWTVCSAVEVEEAKSIIRLCPIWFTSLAFTIVYAQASTFFTKQGVTMDRTLWKGFKMPAASLQVFIGLAIVIFIPIYDRVFVPLVRISTHRTSGITTLQRVGAGLFVSIICMITAALVEIRRLRTAEEYGLVVYSSQTIPMTVWWLIPQYVLMGLSEALVMVGLQEFFYDQVPSELRSVGLSLYLSVLGVGSIISSILISIIVEITGSHGWFNSNLNKAHLDYFYWLLAGMSALGLAAFSLSARSYIYKRRRT